RPPPHHRTPTQLIHLLPGIAEAVFARSWSGHTALRAIGATLSGPAPTVLGVRDAARLTDQGEQALYASKVISYAAREIGDAQLPWHLVVAHATRDGVPAPAFAAALAHCDTLRTPRLPAALIQAQRDHFGAHTYRRTEEPALK
ncbi:hypothetical protein PV350_14925, partial [Streptomyces sp. PA03-6a]|nr:hypothetical protein [Streptomyces sp. PA03-6a]